MDTREYVSGSGQLPVTLQATNAAALPSAPLSETLNVDNDPVSVSLSTPDDSNPTVWVNHAVTVDATPSTGPSGLGGMNCSVDGGAAQSYPAGGLTVNGDGVRTVSCTAWNNAVDPQGNHNSGTSSVTAHIDEAPPAVSLEPVNPNDPTGVVVDTSDSESGVAGGSIEMAPAGTGSWTALPTTFTGSQLRSSFQRRRGARPVHVQRSIVRQRRQLRLNRSDGDAAGPDPGRLGGEPRATPALRDAPADPSSTMLLHCPREVARERVSGARLAGDSGLSLADGGFLRPHAPADPAPTAAGGIFASGSSAERRAVAVSPETASGHRKATMRPHEKPHKSCGTSAARLATRATVAFGRPVRLHGLLLSSAGVPLAGQPVAILTAPDNGSNAFTEAAAVTTGPDGSWTATLPPGPSRIIEASYPGSPTILPATGSATVITPAKIVLTSVTPDRTPWGSTVRITGRVLGGYIPASSKLLRLDLGIVGIPGLSKIQGIPNVSPDGTFTTTYKFARYRGVVRFWLQVSSLAEADFPFSPSHSRRLIVTVGVPAPTTTTSHVRHRRVRRRHRRSASHRGLARRGEQLRAHRSGRARRR